MTNLRQIKSDHERIMSDPTTFRGVPQTLNPRQEGELHAEINAAPIKPNTHDDSIPRDVFSLTVRLLGKKK